MWFLIEFKVRTAVVEVQLSMSTPPHHDPEPQDSDDEAATPA